VPSLPRARPPLVQRPLRALHHCARDNRHRRAARANDIAFTTTSGLADGLGALVLLVEKVYENGAHTLFWERQVVFAAATAKGLLRRNVNYCAYGTPCPKLTGLLASAPLAERLPSLTCAGKGRCRAMVPFKAHGAWVHMEDVVEQKGKFQRSKVPPMLAIAVANVTMRTFNATWARDIEGAGGARGNPYRWRETRRV
jgi:hypothetical protein